MTLLAFTKPSFYSNFYLVQCESDLSLKKVIVLKRRLIKIVHRIQANFSQTILPQSTKDRYLTDNFCQKKTFFILLNL